jgi:PTS system nitrogen regulatory IIA component
MLLDSRDAARFLGIDEGTLHRWVRRGELRALQVHDQLRFDRVDLLEFASVRGMAVAPEMFADPGANDPMPRIAEALTAGGVHPEVVGSDPASVLAAVVDRLPVPPGVDRAFLLQMLVAREQLGSTAIGNGIALPHPRNPIVLRVSSAAVALCYLAAPVEFGALDGKPVHTLFTVVSPSVRVHLHLLALLGAALQDPRFAAAVEGRAELAELVTHLERVEAALAARRAAARGDRS